VSTFFIIVALSYLLGSIPFGYLLVRILRGEDVRISGSGNIGATNVSRTSPLLGAATLVLDLLKGTAAVVLAHRLAATSANPKPLPQMAMAALFAVVGHIFPVWLKFRGGKGVATGLGSFLVITPKAVLVAIGIFLLILFAFRYVSLASIVAVGFFPFLIANEAFMQGKIPAMDFITVTSILIIVRHHQNIRRLIAGKETRVGARRI
jgi:acyl phosphate:glycerol-3-phosphate acyltransferase